MDNKTSPKDVFLHLLMTSALYTSAGSFLVLIFQYINILLPDLLLEQGGRYALTSYYQSIRWALASLVVVFPVYVLTSWFLNKDYSRNPSKRNLRIRKWLLYFTLFAAALIVIGDLVTLVYNFLQGELTLRFILKVLAVGFVSGSVFGYYFVDIRKHKTE